MPVPDQPKPASSAQPTRYQLRVRGHLDRKWSDWFGGLTVTADAAGDTLLTGPVVDQAELHGLLRKVRDLGIPLLAVTPLESDPGDMPAPERCYQEAAMQTTQRTPAIRDRRVVLSTLWIFVMLNYIYADVYTLFFNPVLRPEEWKLFLAGDAGGVPLTEGFVLLTAVLMETAIAMVLLSRVLGYGPNRWANIGSGLFHTAFVAWSLTGQPPTLSYAFFATIEIACTLFIVGYAWTWRYLPATASTALPDQATCATTAPSK